MKKALASKLAWLKNHKMLTAMSVTGLLLWPVSGILTGIAIGAGVSWEVAKHQKMKARAKQLGCKSLKEYKQKFLKE